MSNKIVPARPWTLRWIRAVIRDRFNRWRFRSITLAHRELCLDCKVPLTITGICPKCGYDW